MSRQDVLNDNNQENIETNSAVAIDNDSNNPVENTTNQDSEYKQSEIDKVSSQTGEYLVCQGATCLCDQGEKIHLELNVLSNKKVFLNESSALATIDDNVLKGNFSKCKLNPSSGKPCVYQPKNKWDWKSGIQDYFSEVNGKKYLTDHAILKCPMFPGIITLSYNGQEIDVPESDKEDLDSSIDSSIICLMDDHVEPTDEQKKKKPNITSLSVLINEKSINSQSQNIKKIYLRKDKEYEFTATDKKNVGYNYWYVREKQDTDTNPKELPFFVDKGSVYEQTGSKAKFTFKQNGIFYLEAFGTLANKKKIYTDCAFEIEVVDKNKINDIKLTPTERERQDKTKLLLDKNTLYTIELQTLLPIEDEDLEGLSVEVHDTSIRFIPPGAENLPLFKGKDAMRFALKTSDWGSYSLQIKRGKDIIKEYSFPIVENEVKKVHIIDPKVGNLHWVRPGTYVTFEAELSDNKDERKRIYWKLDTSEISDEHDKRWKHLFSRTADHTVKASYRGFLGMGSSNTGSCSVIVKPNKIEAVKADKKTQSICIGTDVTFSVDTPYIDLIDSEYIQWELRKTNLGISLPSKKMQYSIKANGTDVLNDSWVKLGSNHNKDKNLSIQFNQLGTYTLTVSMGGKPFETPTLINVVKAHIESWYFCDKEGNKRSKIGWGQDFYIRIKINGCEGRHLKIAFWYDSRSKNINNRFYKIDSGVEQQDLTLGKEGLEQWKISSTKLWTSLQNLVKEHGSSSKSEYARFMFTISEIDTLCDNNKEYKKDHPLHGQIFPEKTDNTTASIPNTTEYKALFLDSSKKKPLTDIISYTDQAYISLQRINSPQDIEVKDLELRLWENKTGEDTLLQRVKISSFDKEGYIVPHPVDMSQITKTKQKNHSKTLPRFFYLQLCKMKDNKVDKIIYTYPEGYKTGKDNDSEIIELQKDDYTAEDIKKEPAQEVVVSSAKYIHNINQILLPEKDKKEFDESKLNNQTANQKNQTAQKQNKETIDKSKNYFLQLKIAQDPNEQRSRYNRTGKQVGEAGSNFESPKNTNCVCDERIRAFMQMLRVGEGTSGEIGYSMRYGLKTFTDLSKHPEVVYSGGSSAAGAYQIMRYTWWELNGWVVKNKLKTDKHDDNKDYAKKYKITDYKAISQDKYCIILFKYYRTAMLTLIQQGKIREAIKEYGCKEWASLPCNDGSESNYWMPDKSKKQPATPMNQCLSDFDKYFQEELNGSTTLHLEKKFRKEFEIECKCEGCIKDGELCPECRQKHIDLRDKFSFAAQSTGTNCFASCKAIIAKLKLTTSGPYDSQTYYITKENKETKVLEFDSNKNKKGIEYLNDSLSKGIPVIVGVDHTFDYKIKKGKEYPNVDKTTDHFVVIMRKYCFFGDVRYEYWDVATRYGATNKCYFTFNSGGFLESNKTWKEDRKYTITQIRTSK